MSPLSKEQSPIFKENLPSKPTDIPLEGVLLLRNTDTYIERLLDSSWALHGRLASREQIRLQLSFPQHRDWVKLFFSWWEYGMRSWRRRAGDDATLTFLCELGPPEYAMTGSDGYKLSDRWEEAKSMATQVRELWRQVAK